jgi:phage repressor protein C with HTH and peptisase S24 domain
MSELSTRLLQAIEQLGLKKNKFADISGISPGYLNDILKGRATPSDRVIKDICEKNSINEIWLRDNKGEMFLKAEAVSPPSPADDKQTRRIDGFVLVPLFNVEASAGGGALVPEEEVIDRLAFKEEWIKRDLGVNPSDLALITTIGDSMEPTLRAGDMILLDKSVETVKDEAVYAFLVDGMLLIKRVRWEADGGLSLLSDNSVYSPVVISRERKAELRVVGRLIWAGRRF